MPVSGRPTNAALLKTTHGSSGPVRKGFQKVSKAAEVGLASPAKAVGVVLRVRKSATNDPARRIERITTAASQERGTCSLVGWTCSGEAWAWRSDLDAASFLWKARVYVPLGSSMRTWSSAPSPA